MSTRIQIRGDTSANWVSVNPVLAAREPGFETDTGLVKYGDGVLAWTSLPYSNSGSNTVTVLYDTVAGSWPARPLTATYVHWVDPRLSGATPPPSNQLHAGDVVMLAS